MDAKQLLEVAQNLFTKKMSLNSLHQEISENFFPERADFTLTRSMGMDFAANLMSSYPVTCRRELGNQFSTMLRPTAKKWFHVNRRHEEKEQTDVKVWLEWFEEIQRKVMYDPLAHFTRATKEGDHDFAAFGQCAISVEYMAGSDRQPLPHFLYRSWHLRDMAWQENEEGEIGFVARKWKPTAQTLKRVFGDKVHREVTSSAEKTPFEEVETMHFVCDADMYDDKSQGKARWSIWYDVTHSHLIDAVPIHGKHYIIPRWQTVSGFQYSYSPATVAALPDARLLQAMTYTLLEAGEKATSPPMVATQGVVRSDLALYAGGVTWVDEEYDERLGQALRPLEQDFRGFNFGVQMNQDTRSMLHKAFYLDALTLPQRTGDMTAFEVSQRVQEYIRAALPLFEPMEQEYNAALCDETFSMILRVGGFGDPRQFPKQLRGADISFSFESPLHDLIEQQKGQLFQQSQALIGAAIAMDPGSAALPKTDVMLRDALHGIGAPATWMNTEAYVEDQKRQAQAQQAQQSKLAMIEQASNAAKNIGQSGLAPGMTGQ